MRFKYVGMEALGGLFFGFLLFCALMIRVPEMMAFSTLIISVFSVLGPALFIVFYQVLRVFSIKSAGFMILFMNIIVVSVVTFMLSYVPVLCFNGILQTNADNLELKVNELRIELTEEEQKLASIIDSEELETQMKIINDKNSEIASTEGIRDATLGGQLELKEVCLPIIPWLYLVYSLVCLTLLYFYDKKQSAYHIGE